MSAGGCYCLQMWALGNHKTQSLWSIPEPLPLYIAFSSSTHNLSPFHSCSLTHNTHFIFFPSTFHLSSASATPHLCPPSPPPTLTLSLCFIIYYSSLLFVSGHWTFFLSAPPPPPPTPQPPNLLPLRPDTPQHFPPPQAITPSPPLVSFHFHLLLSSPFVLHHTCARRWRGSIDCTLGWQAPVMDDSERTRVCVCGWVFKERSRQ